MARGVVAAVLAVAAMAVLLPLSPAPGGEMLVAVMWPMVAFTAYVATVVLHPERREEGKD